MRQGLLRTSAIILAFICGFLLPELNEFNWLIRWLIIAMLLMTFLGVRVTRLKPTPRHWLLISANLLGGILAYALFHVLGHENLALAAFFVGITPTATAAPVIMGFLGGNIEFVLTSFILSNVIICASLPLLMPAIVGTGGLDIYGQIAGSVALVMLLPAFLAWLIRKYHKKAVLWPSRFKNISFGAWVACLLLISSHASYDIHHNPALSKNVIWEIGAISLLLCILNFTAGYFIGGKNFRRECSQSLGQKNTTLTILLAMMYAPTPIAALGPTFYVLWHNLWNAWQLQRRASEKTKDPGETGI